MTNKSDLGPWEEYRYHIVEELVRLGAEQEKQRQEIFQLRIQVAVGSAIAAFVGAGLGIAVQVIGWFI